MTIERNPDVVNMMFGSHLYGLNHVGSDIDIKGIYLPTKRELWLGDFKDTYKESTGKAHEKNAPGDIDREVMSLPRFVRMALSGETMALDMLHCNTPLSSSPIWEQLHSNRTKFYTNNLSTFVRYVRRQAAKYGVKGSRLADIKLAMEFMAGCPQSWNMKEVWEELPETQYLKKIEITPRHMGATTQYFYEVTGKKYQSTMIVSNVHAALVAMYEGYGDRAKLAEKNDGVDWKSVSHALRAGYQARDIFTFGDFNYPLNETDFLLKVKLGQVDFKKVLPVIEELTDEVEVLSAKSSLPDTPDREMWDNWLIDIYEEYCEEK